MWVFKTAGDKNSKIVYHYSPTRNSDVISSFLSGFEGNPLNKVCFPRLALV
jgi:hypothetical protein